MALQHECMTGGGGVEYYQNLLDVINDCSLNDNYYGNFHKWRHVLLRLIVKFLFLDVLLGESYAVCLKRFQFLLDGSAPLIAFNVSHFIISNVFDSERRSSSLIVKRWLEQASRDGDDVTALLDAHLGLMYKLKKDLVHVDATVSFRFSTCATSKSVNLTF